MTTKQLMEACMYVGIVLGAVMALAGLAIDDMGLLIAGLVVMAPLGVLAWLATYAEEKQSVEARRKRESL